MSRKITVEVSSFNGSANGKQIQYMHSYVQTHLQLHVHTYVGNMDYDSGPYTVMFNVGANCSTFTVNISNDDIFENNETFILKINDSLLPSCVSVGDVNQITITIENDDGEYKVMHKFIELHMYVYMRTY